MEESSNPRNRLHGNYGRVIFLWLLIKQLAASRNILRKITKMVNNSNDQQRCASASIFCEDPFSSSTPYAEELEYNIDFLIEHQDIRQCHFPGDQNRAEDRYEEEAYNPNEEGQHVFQSLSPDVLTKLLKYRLTFLVGMAFSS